MTDRAWSFGWDGSEWFSRRGGGKRRGRRRFFESGDMKYVILKILAEQPMHGYEVMKALEERTKGCYKPSPGSVYPTLQWLEDEELVTSDVKDGKKVYSITDAGQEFLDENKSTVEDIFDRVEEVIDTIMEEPMPELSKVVGRLVAKSYKVSWKYRTDDERRKAIVKVLEDALTEIESIADPADA